MVWVRIHHFCSHHVPLLNERRDMEETFVAQCLANANMSKKNELITQVAIAEERGL